MKAINDKLSVPHLALFIVIIIFIIAYFDINGTSGDESIVHNGTLMANDEISLWDISDGPHLRGANIYQRRVYPEVDGSDYYGPNPVGPPYKEDDFQRLADMGANYVHISHPGLFSENPPYTLDLEMQENLDNLLEMIKRADMFAVIAFRTGPGRSEATFGFTDDPELLRKYQNDKLWQSQEAQDAWLEMWRYTAERYSNNPIVVGYDLMVEPNSNEIGSNAINDRLDIWNPEEFYEKYRGTLYDWNQLYPCITSEIREVDPNTPILIEGMDYSAVNWLPYLQPTSDPNTVYVVHLYNPPEDWLLIINEYMNKERVPVAVTEFGVPRWQHNASIIIENQLEIFEQESLNSAIWVWLPDWEPSKLDDDFNFLHGPDPEKHDNIKSSNLIKVITKHWKNNILRPSYFYR